MSLDLCILASGSAGNCSVVRSPGGLLLLDCGLSARATLNRMESVGARLDAVAGVCLTHLDRDHLAVNFVTWLSRRQIPVFCHAYKVHELRQLAQKQTCGLNIQPFADEPFVPVAGLTIEPISLVHDEAGSHGFLLSADETRIGFATDLGRVPDILIDRFCDAGGLDVLAIESNYCPQLQLASPRPAFLKRRIMGGHGHLSNEQSFAAVRQILNRHDQSGNALPAAIALLHRSRQCNAAERVREVFSRNARITPRLVLSEQHEPTGWIGGRVRRAEQMTFGFA